MKFHALLNLLIIWYTQISLADASILKKVPYQHQDFEIKCKIRSDLEPQHRPLCPRISKYSFIAGLSFDAIRSYIQERLSVDMNEVDFKHSKEIFIAELIRRQREVGVGTEFIMNYDPYLEKIYRSLSGPVVWRNSTTDFLVLVSKKDLTLYLIESAAVQ